MLRPYFIQDVERFQRKFGFETPKEYTRLSDELHNFRAAFLQEELDEFIDGCKTQDVSLALDSLIDLVYIISGTVLFHGIDIDEFYEACFDNANMLFETGEKSHSRPAILQTVNWEATAAYLNQLIVAFRGNHTSGSSGAANKYKNIYILSKMWNVCFNTAKWMGVSSQLWEALWDDVQEANMRKVRATRDDQSKRGSAAFDIVKPPGWKAPDTMSVVNKYYEGLSA